MPVYTPYTPIYQPYSNYPIYQPAYQAALQQPQPQPQPQQMQPASGAQAPAAGMIWVRNAQEAVMYPVAPNNAVALWDSGAPCIYLKQADASGKPSMKTYDLVERQEAPPESAKAADGADAPYATKAELAALAGVVKDVDGLIVKIRKDVDLLMEEKGDE